MTTATARNGARANAPPAPPAGEYQLLPLAQIAPSATNPRKQLGEAKLAELAESIKSKGVLEPILVRKRTVSKPLARGITIAEVSGWEVVAGERRYRAAQLAGLAEIPCRVLELTDREALEIQVIENEQREDLGPLEKAEGYQALLEADYTVEELAARVGKSASAIRALLKLLQLPEKARQAVESGALPASTAELIGRIPGEKLRAAAAKELLYKRHDGTYPSYRQIKEEVQRRFMVELKQAPFAVADRELLPAAGSCKDCPKRTGNNRDEYPDGRADVCTDPACYRQKVSAQRVRACAAARSADVRVLDGDEAETVFRVGPDQYGRSKWLDLAATWYAAGDSQQVQAWLNGALDGERAFACDPEGHGHYLVPRKQAVAIIEAKAAEREGKKQARADRKAGKAATVRNEPGEWQVAQRARALAVQAVGEMGQANFEDLDGLAAEGGAETNAAYQALRLVAWQVALNELEDQFGSGRELLPLGRRIPGLYGLNDGDEDCNRRVAAWVKDAGPRDLLAYLLEDVATHTIDAFVGEFKVIGAELLREFTDEGDFQAFQQRARQELTAELKAKQQEKKGKGKPATSAPEVIEAVATKEENPVVKKRLKRMAKDLNGEPPSGQCRICGCTEQDCRNCVERTGEPCGWTSPSKDLCTACLPLLEADLGILYVGKSAREQAEMRKFDEACLRTVGQVLNLGGTIGLPKGITGERAAELREEAMAWLQKQTTPDLPAGITRDTFLIDLLGDHDVRREGGALEAAGLHTVGDLLDRCGQAKGPKAQRPYTVLRGVKGLGAVAACAIGDQLVDAGLVGAGKEG